LSLADEIRRLLPGGEVIVLAQSGFQWRNLAQPEDRQSIAAKFIDVIAAAMESTVPIQRQATFAAAIHHGGEDLRLEWEHRAAVSAPTTSPGLDVPEFRFAPHALMITFSTTPSPTDVAVLRDLSAAMAKTLQTVDICQHKLGLATDAACHLRTVLDASIRWSQIDDTNRLLESIATASAQMIGTERASIFLWEKKRGKLIGRPALGLDGGHLEVDDNAGIVGTVLSTGQPKVWDQTEDQESEVNRSVDRRTHFQTHSIAAVPLRSPSGATIGVFELLNKIAGRFDEDDVSRLSDLARHAATAIQESQTRQRLSTACDRLLSDAASTSQVIGNCAAIVTLRDTVSRVAKTDLSVLVLGENGTGKEVVARSIHFQSPRRDQTFVAINCAAIVESLLESELFGHERGAFTDAVQSRPGKFELASGGTLFLDEIGDMSLGGQAKLLRVLEEKLVTRVGGSIPIPVDVRIIAATNQSLPDLVASKRFREDLFFRLTVVSFRLPALRDRADDVLTLATHFLQHFSAQIGRVTPTFSSEAKQALLTHRWPGNIRELRNVMERVCYLSSNDVLTESDLGLMVWDTSPPAAFNASADVIIPKPTMAASTWSLGDATRDFQISHIEGAIDKRRGNMTAAAELLGLHRSNLYRKMRQLGMKFDEDAP